MVLLRLNPGVGRAAFTLVVVMLCKNRSTGCIIGGWMRGFAGLNPLPLSSLSFVVLFSSRLFLPSRPSSRVIRHPRRRLLLPPPLLLLHHPLPPPPPPPPLHPPSSHPPATSSLHLHHLLPPPSTSTHPFPACTHLLLTTLRNNYHGEALCFSSVDCDCEMDTVPLILLRVLLRTARGLCVLLDNCPSAASCSICSL